MCNCIEQLDYRRFDIIIMRFSREGIKTIIEDDVLFPFAGHNSAANETRINVVSCRNGTGNGATPFII